MSLHPPASRSHGRLPVLVAHRTTQRLRLKIPERRHDPTWFAAAAERLSSLPAVETVLPNPSTGSLLVLHRSGAGEAILDELPERIGSIRLLDRTNSSAPPLTDRLRSLGREWDSQLRRLTGGEIDLTGLTFVLLAGLAVLQLARGQFGVPAVSALWYAIGALQFMPDANSSEPRQAGLRPVSDST